MRILIGLAVVLLALAGLTGWRAARNEARAEDTHPPLGHLLSIGGQQVHASVQGTGPDLVLIHGSSGNLRDFTFRLAGQLCTRYRVIAFDRPGLGYSDAVAAGVGSLEAQADTLMMAAAQLGADRPIVLGHSLGGGAALAWAVYHPDRLSALVTVSGVSHPWPGGLGAYYTVLSSWPGRHVVIPLMTAFVSEDRIAAEIDAVFAPAPPPEGYIDHFGPRLSLRRDAMRANALQRRGLYDWVAALVPRYPAIEVPTEILHAADDPTVGHDIHSVALAEAVPGARLTTLPGASHMLHHTDPEAVIAAIDRAATRAGLR